MRKLSALLPILGLALLSACASSKYPQPKRVIASGPPSFDSWKTSTLIGLEWSGGYKFDSNGAPTSYESDNYREQDVTKYNTRQDKAGRLQIQVQDEMENPGLVFGLGASGRKKFGSKAAQECAKIGGRLPTLDELVALISRMKDDPEYVGFVKGDLKDPYVWHNIFLTPKGAEALGERYTDFKYSGVGSDGSYFTGYHGLWSSSVYEADTKKAYYFHCDHYSGCKITLKDRSENLDYSCVRVKK